MPHDPEPSTTGEPKSAAESARLLHELEMHKTELQIQNEELRATEEQLRKAHDDTAAALTRYTDLYDCAPVGFFTFGPDGTIHLVNRAGAALIGEDPARLTGGQFGFWVADADRPIFSGFLARVFKNEPSQSCELTLEIADAPPRVVAIEGALVPGRDRCRTVAIDITRRKQAEDALREALQIREEIMNSIPVRVFWKDRDLIYLGCNLAFATDAGMADPREIVGKSDHQLAWSDQADCYRGDDREVIATGRPKLLVEEPQTTPDGNTITLLTSKIPMRNFDGEISGVLGTYMDITDCKVLEERLRLQGSALEAAANSIVITNRAGVIEWANPAFSACSGYTVAESVGKKPGELLRSGQHEPGFYQALWQTILAGNIWHGEIINRRKDGSLFYEEMTITPIVDGGTITHFIAVKQEITERKRHQKEREMLELHLRQAQKLESIGQLAAGIAHEINTPTQYIGDNARFIREACGDLLQIVAVQSRVVEAVRAGAVSPEMLAEADAAVQTADMEYLIEEIPRALDQTLEGVGRVTKIVQAMKDFSHPGSSTKTPTHLDRAIESTVTVCRSEWKYVAEVVMEFDPELPAVPLLPGEFNQVILNLVVNACHAIADVVGDSGKGKGVITIRARRDGDWAELRIGDNGAGIPEASRDKIFTPFFTTKEVGKGTGQGLALARSVVVDRHRGTIDFETAEGKGTTFVIRLPLANADSV